jgi:hypothetical protein
MTMVNDETGENQNNKCYFNMSLQLRANETGLYIHLHIHLLGYDTKLWNARLLRF